MSEQPIKLTDEPNRMHWLSDAAISDMRDGMVEGGVWEYRADAFCAAIRALRDRARAVVEDATIEDNRRDVVDQKLIEVLP